MNVCLSVLIVLARISSTVLNKSGEREHPSLVLDLRKKSFQLVSFDFINYHLIIKVLLCCNIFLLFPIFQFYYEKVLNFIKHILHVYGLQSFISLMWLLSALNHPAFVEWIPLSHSKFNLLLFSYVLISHTLAYSFVCMLLSG